MEIIRNGQKIVLTEEEIYQAFLEQIEIFEQKDKAIGIPETTEGINYALGA